MLHFLSSPRFLAVYSGLVTILFVVTIISGFATRESQSTFDEITVHRVNVVEPLGAGLSLGDIVCFGGKEWPVNQRY
jgi:hypothetical protein